MKTPRLAHESLEDTDFPDTEPQDSRLGSPRLSSILFGQQALQAGRITFTFDRSSLLISSRQPVLLLTVNTPSYRLLSTLLEAWMPQKLEIGSQVSLLDRLEIESFITPCGRCGWRRLGGPSSFQF